MPTVRGNSGAQSDCFEQALGLLFPRCCVPSIPVSSPVSCADEDPAVSTLLKADQISKN